MDAGGLHQGGHIRLDESGTVACINLALRTIMIMYKYCIEDSPRFDGLWYILHIDIVESVTIPGSNHFYTHPCTGVLGLLQHIACLIHTDHMSCKDYHSEVI